jgi:hypothetical protein
MPKHTAPDPGISVIAVRTAAQRAACLYAKGVGDRMVLKEAAAIFASLCPALPRPSAKRGRELAMTEAKARKPLPECEPALRTAPPLALLAALARPAQPGDDPAALPASGTPQDRRVPQTRRDGEKPAGVEYARGNLRLIPGGRSVAEQGG